MTPTSWSCLGWIRRRLRDSGGRRAACFRPRGHRRRRYRSSRGHRGASARRALCCRHSPTCCALRDGILRIPHSRSCGLLRRSSIHGWLDAWCLGWAQFDWDGGPVWGWTGSSAVKRAILRPVPTAGAQSSCLATAAPGGRCKMIALPRGDGEVVRRSDAVVAVRSGIRCDERSFPLRRCVRVA